MNKYILALTGPSGVGKTTLCRQLTSMVGDLVSPVPILTTRGPKAGDDGEYVHCSTDEFTALQEAEQIAAATTIPSASELRCYGYKTADIEAVWHNGKLPVVITEMNLLMQLSDYFGRRTILSFGLLPPGDSRRMMLSHLLHRLRSRGRETEEQIADRIENAKDDLQFFEDRQDLFNTLLINDQLTVATDTLIEHVRPQFKEA